MESARAYTYDTLFDLIDGGAEVYRALNVRTVMSQSYGRADAPDIMVDIFDMGSAADAFGAYHNDTREEASAGIGNESERMGASLFFWKGRYFVSVVPFAEHPAAERAVPDLGRAIAGAIREGGTVPAIVAFVPRAGLIDSQLTYFHTWPHLSTRRFISSDNLLALDAQTEGVLARYRGTGGEPGPSLILVRYPSPARARQGYERYTRTLPDPVARLPSGKWAGAARYANLVACVLDGLDRSEVHRLLAAVRTARGD
jgi:hypothetical protein